MNPFDFSGPVFLVFYVGLMALVLWPARLLRSSAEEAALPKLKNLDPYALAYLRVGATEVLVVSLVSLLDRGLLHAQGGVLVAAPGAKEQVRRPFERALLSHFSASRAATDVFSATSLVSSTAEVRRDLIRLGLLPSESQMDARITRAAVSSFVLGGVGAVKVLVAAARGRTNVIFLLGLMVLAVILILRELRKKRTTGGDRALEDAQELCRALRNRAESLTFGTGSYDLTLLIGAFGLTALKGAAREALTPLFPRTFQRGAASSETSTTSSCGASCGSVSTWGASSSSCGSSSSSCGSSSSSCGSSSCGGGCGGCGGGGD